MNILIWKSYGETDVICAETPEQLTRILDDVCAIVKDWSMEDSIFVAREAFFPLAKKQVSAPLAQLAKLRGIIKDLVDAAGRDNESFEDFYFSNVKY